MYAADGPPKPSGTPRRCDEPTAIYAFISFGDLNNVKARGSVDRIDIH